MLAMLWGGSFVAIKEVVRDIPSWFAAAARLWVATFSLYILFKYGMHKSLRLSSGSHLRVWFTGLITIGIPFAFLFWGERFISAGLAGMLNGSVPLLTAGLVLIAPTQDERGSLSVKTLAGLGIGFLGILAIFAPLISEPGSQEFWGALAVAMMAVCYALGNILNKRNFQNFAGLSVYAAVFHQSLASLIFLSLGAAIFDPLPSWQTLTAKPSTIPSIIYLGTFSTALALTLYFYLIKKWGSVKTSAIAYLIPLFTIIFDALIFKNFPTLPAWLGMALILLGITLIRKREPKKIMVEIETESAEELTRKAS